MRNAIDSRFGRKAPTRSSLPAGIPRTGEEVRADGAGRSAGGPVSGGPRRRTAPARPGRSSRPPRSRSGSRRSSPSTARARGRAPPRGAAPDSSAQRDEGRPGVLGPLARAARRSSARAARAARAAARPRRARRASSSGSKPALAGSPSTLTWRRTGTRPPGRTSAGEAVEPLGELDRIDRLDHGERSRAPASPCSTGAGRPDATSRPAPRRTFASASWTRFSPRTVEAGRDRGDEPLGRDRLRDGDERDGRRIATGARAGRGDRARTRSAGRRERAATRRPGRAPATATCGAGSDGISRSSASYAAARLTGTGSPTVRSIRGAITAAAGRSSRPSSRAVARLGRWRSSSSRKSRSRGAPDRRLLAGPGWADWAVAGGVALAVAVEAGRDDRDHHLFAEPVVEARPEDDVRLRIGRGADLLGGLGHLEQAAGSRSR